MPKAIYFPLPALVWASVEEFDEFIEKLIYRVTANVLK